MTKKFILKHRFFIESKPAMFTENSPPQWLLGGIKGSTMDTRWFWTDHILTLSVGESINTDFRTITRVE